MTTTRRPRLAVGLAGAHLLELTAGQERQENQDALVRLDEVGAAFLALGVDRALGAPGRATLDPSIAAAALAARSTTPFLVVAAPQRDHPYNLARRIASLDHLADGRAGLLLAERDLSAPLAEAGREAWGGARLSPGAPLEPTTTRDAALALAALWQSFPVESIVGDRESRVYAEADRIVHIDHHGVFDIAGPLTVPTTPQGAPVLGWAVTSVDELRAAAGVAELLVATPGIAAADAAPAVFRPLRIEGQGTIDAALSDGDSDLLILADPSVPVAHLIAAALDLVDRGRVERSPGSTLRERLSLGAARPLPADARPAFAASAELRAS